MRLEFPSGVALSGTPLIIAEFISELNGANSGVDRGRHYIHSTDILDMNSQVERPGANNPGGHNPQIVYDRVERGN